MNRHLTSLIALGAFVFSANCAQLTPEEAINRLVSEGGVTRKVVSTGKLKLAYTASTGDINQFYVFSNPGEKGFSIVAADDCVAPLLGYSAESSFEPADMPDNMKAWLEGYQRQIDWAIANGMTTTRTAAKVKRDDISPLIQTRWDQSDPYNLLCPTYGDNVKCASGCVATAMAQIMNYHEWPEKGKGSNSYSCYNPSISTNFGTLAMNFANTTFDWANMTDRYNSSSTEAQKNAVATLMYACGISVNMIYGPSSGAQSTKGAAAFVNYFDYDKGTTYYLRDYFSGSEWEKMIYDELAAKRPVMYDGVTGNNEGHEFVCDGYSDGYFHINWGWGGMSDGYFLLSALDPGMQGTGGGSSGFNFLQGATLGIQKPVAGSVNKSTLVGAKEFYTDRTTYTRSGSIRILNRQYIYYPADGTIDVRLGLKLIDADGNERYIFSPAEASTITGMSTAIQSYPIDGSSLPQSGTYTAKPAYYNTATEQWSDILIPINCSQGFTVTIDGNSITFTPLPYNPQLTISNVNILTPLYGNANFHVTATATSSNDEYYGTIRAALCRPGTKSIVNRSSQMQIDVEPGTPLEIDIISEFTRSTTVGDYDFVFIDASDNIVSEPVSVKYLGNLTSKGSIEIISFEPEASSMPQNNIVLNGTIKCTSGYLDEPLYIYLFEPGNNYSVTTWTTETLWLGEGESADFTIKGEYLDGKTGLSQYTACISYDGDLLEPYARFRLKKATTGIDEAAVATAAITPNPADNYVTVTAESIDMVKIYSLAGVCVLSADGDGSDSLGIDVSHLAPGNYIATVNGADGITTLRLIKR